MDEQEKTCFRSAAMPTANREEALFAAVLEKPTAAERAAYLEGACGDDHALRSRIQALLAAHDGSGGVLDAPPSGLGGTAAHHAPAEGPCTRIGPYKLFQELGEGGMGTVFMAEQQEPVRRMVAIKVIKPGMDSKDVLARFEAERQAIALMDHPNIAKVLDAGTTGERSQESGDRSQELGVGKQGIGDRLLTPDSCLLTPNPGRPYFVMELVKGVPITKYCDDHELSPRERLELFVPICQAIQHAHQKGVIHRDIKPSNVLVATYDGRPVPKVIDFGVAKAMGKRLTDRTLFTAFGHVVGTLEYMSPEQAELDALDVDTRSDVYALGVLLYELLTGSTPLSRKTLKQAALGEALRLIREEEPPKPSTRLSTAQALPSIAAHRKTEPAKLSKMMRGELDWMVMQALEKDRNRRYESASAFAADVQRYLRDEPVAACPPSAGYRLRKFARRHKAALRTTLGAAAVLLLAVVGVSWVLWDRAAQEAASQADWSKRLAETKQTVDVALVKADQHRNRAAETVSATSREADAALVTWGQADAALAQAEAALKAGTADDHLKERVLALQKPIQQGRGEAERRRAKLQRQEKLLLDLDEARMAPLVFFDGHFDVAGAGVKVAAAFTAYGLEVRPGGAEELGRRIRAEEPAVREALIVALDFWAGLAVWAHLADGADAAGFATTGWSAAEMQALAGMADDDPWRRRFRAASSAQDRQALLSLSDEAHRLAMPPANLLLLALSLRSDSVGGKEEAIALLRWARNRHPTDFWIALELGAPMFLGVEGTPAELEEAIGCARVALALRPDASLPYFALGSCLAKKGESDEAITAFHKAIEISPKFAWPHVGIGLVLRGKKQFDKAIAAFHKAIEVDAKTETAYHHLGLALHSNKQFDDAIAAFRVAIKIYPKFHQAYRGLGWALRANNQLDEAIAAFRMAIAINPKYAVAYNHLGIALRDKNQLDEAIIAFREAVRLDPKNAVWQNRLGIALQAKNQLDEAIGAFREAVRLDPKNAVWQNDLAWMLDNWADPRYRDPKSALDYAKNAVRLKPEVGHHWNTLGNAYYRNGDWKAALETLNKAVAVGKVNDDNFFWLAMTHWKLGDRDAARTWYDKGVSALSKSARTDSLAVEEFERYRAEAAEVLGIQSSTAPSKDAPLVKKNPA
jgi:serine/threonine protein kinase/Flp pilus assembly protein TadD